MGKTAAQNVRNTEARHRERGEREIRVWIPDTSEAVAQVRALAASLCAQAIRDMAGGV